MYKFNLYLLVSKYLKELMDLKQFANLYFRLMEIKKSVKEPMEKKMENMESKQEDAMYKKVQKEVIKRLSKKGKK